MDEIMKKKILAIPIIAVLVCIAGFVGKSSAKTDRERALDENIEALADEENTGSVTNYRICYSESKVATGYTYYDCGSCQKVYDEKGKGSKSKCFLN